MHWNTHLKHLMGEAAHLMRKGRLADATRAIQKTLASRSFGTATMRSQTTADKRPASPPAWQAPHAPDADVQDAQARAQPSPPSTPAAAELPGTFQRVGLAHQSAHGLHHHYHLYVPPGAATGTVMPLVVMLHGCTQNPLDFAKGTGMNAAAAPANALVLYPEQPQSANPNRCWNWFRPEDQSRGRGEPALLVAMVRDVMARHHVDAQRIYVAGLSAGGAMAALLGREYPDVFAAVGVHSGLQAGAAHNVITALSAMKNGAKLGGTASSPGATVAPPPVIVFHGDADTTVHAHNGEQLVDAALKALAAAPGGVATTVQETHTGHSPSQQGYTRTVYYRQSAPGEQRGAAVAEHWVLHGAGHAWAGGHAHASHTDPRGVNATQEMLRFFLSHPQADKP